LLPERKVTEWSAPTGEVVMVERAVPASWVGYKLDDMESPGKIRIAALSRAGKPMVPKPGLVGQESDVLYVSLAVEAMDELEDRLVKGPRR
jgi:Trk K+ transport system NAD-binding subunit